MSSLCVQAGNLKSNTVQNFIWLERSRGSSPCIIPRHHPSTYTTPKPPSFPRPKSSSNPLFVAHLKLISPAQEKDETSTLQNKSDSHPDRYLPQVDILLSQPDRLPSHSARSDSHPDRLLPQVDRLPSQLDTVPSHSARSDSHPDILLFQLDRLPSHSDRVTSHSASKIHCLRNEQPICQIWLPYLKQQQR